METPEEDEDELFSLTMPTTTTTPAPGGVLPQNITTADKLLVDYVEKEKQVVVVQSYVRRYLAQKVLKELKKKNKHRNFIVKEILETEKVYVKNLNLIVDVYLKPLRVQLRAKKPLLSPADISSIFSNIEMLINVNNTLLQDLKQRIEVNWSPNQCIGDVFSKMVMYTKTTFFLIKKCCVILLLFTTTEFKTSNYIYRHLTLKHTPNTVQITKNQQS